MAAFLHGPVRKRTSGTRSFRWSVEVGVRSA